MAAIVFAGHLLSGGIKVILPSRAFLYFYDDVSPHEVNYSFGNTALMIAEGGIVEMAFTSQGCQWFTFYQAID